MSAETFAARRAGRAALDKKLNDFLAPLPADERLALLWKITDQHKSERQARLDRRIKGASRR